MPAINKKYFNLSTKIAVLSFGTVILSIFIGVFVVVERLSDSMENEIGMRAMAIARTLAQFEEIQKNVGTPGGGTVIQPIAERTRLATGVEYVVILDMEGTRYSHPVEERIGNKFTDADLGPALANNEYISKAQGVLGPSVRAFVPVKVDEGTRQVGVVLVGVLTPTKIDLLKSIQISVYYAIGIGMAIGLAGSFYLSRRIKSAMFNMEPEEMARLLEERVAVFQSISEGIIAIDSSSRITIVNNEAIRIIGRSEDEIIGKYIADVIPGTLMPEVINTGQSQLNSEMIINNTIVLAKRVPIKYQGEIIGAVATFQDKTEVNRLAEELTGVKSFVEALRVQNHEYMNKLHTIAGLIQLEKSQQALDYIFDITEEQQELTRIISKNIFDHSIAGLILGKYARAKELRVNLEIDRSSKLFELPPCLETGDMVAVIGNLIENALDAVRQSEQERRKVYFAIFDNPGDLIITVRDWGSGIPEEKLETIFNQGYTTKGSADRGIGLYLVRQYVVLAGGRITVKNLNAGGAEFSIIIPKKDKTQEA
ncbi:ATP-binding protein [Pelotomaculum propionicicum]|uniref:ATP-binding protein n=1 Tax=Pelotomaculum propionicicum TaxID=258475 RepID=UPI003B7F5036